VFGSKGRWPEAFLGAGLGLFLGRLWAEFGPADWPASLLVAAGLAALCTGLAPLARRRLNLTLGPLAAGYLYVFWPRVDPDVAGFVALVVVLGLILTCLSRGAEGQRGKGAGEKSPALPGFSAPWLLRPLAPLALSAELLVFLVSLTLYVATLAPSVLPADSGEFQLVSRTLGIAHPPGYPLYTLLGWLFTGLPAGDPAWRVNLLSAVLAAGTLTLVTRVVRRLTGSTVAGLVGALALGGATTFWAQATTANIRSLTALFTALLLMLLIEYRSRRQEARDGRHGSSRILLLASFVFGLAVTHHGSLGFLALPAAAYVLLTTPRILADGRLLLRLAGAFALALLVLVYLPLRGAMGAPLDPGGLTTAAGFLRHVLALGFQGDLFYFTRPAVLADRLLVLGDIFKLQFGLPLLALAALGLVRLARYQWKDALLLGGALAVNAGIAITYRAPQTVEYLMPSYVALALLMGVGAAGFDLRGQASRWRTAVTSVLLATLLTLGIWNAWGRYPSFRALSQDDSTRTYAEGVLEAASPGALILSNWHHTTPFWYLQQVEGLRPDVQVSYVSPWGAEPIGETWRRRVMEAAARWSSVIVTNRYLEFASLPHRLVPFHGAFRLETQPTNDLPADAVPMDVTFEAPGEPGQRFRLRGYQVDLTTARPGQVIPALLFWEPMGKVERDYSVFVHLVDDVGTVWGQRDTTPPADAWQPGALLADQHRVPILLHTPPGRYHLVAGLYITLLDGGWERLRTSTGGDVVRLAEVTVLPATEPPVSLQPLYLAFADGSTLVGIDFDHSLPESLRLYLHWWRPGPLPASRIRLYGDDGLLSEGALPATSEPGYLTTANDLPSGARRLRVELLNAAGGRLPARGPWGAPVERPGLLDPRPGQRYLIFGGEMALTAIRVRAGAVDLRWTALRPLTRDYSVSVQVTGPGWRAQDDGTPALGAIPTLKWIRGMQVSDRHRLIRPADAQGQGTLTVSVYDAFTLEPLIVLDDRFLKLGQGQAAHVGPW